MAIPWFKRFRDRRELPYVLDKATAWKLPIEAAVASFNKLAFDVRLIPAKEGDQPLIAFVLAEGPMKHHFPGGVAETGPKFKPEKMHGQAALALDGRKVIYFVTVFLPGKVQKITKDQKEMVIVHEIIHACGMDEHDTEGIMYDVFLASGSGVIEMVSPKGTPAMPPIRVGGTTVSIMRTLWPPPANTQAP